MTVSGRNEPCPCGSGLKYKKCCLSAAPVPVERLMRQAVEATEAGRLGEAAPLVEQVLAAQPHHADALHLSGLVANRLGDVARALERIERALRYAPANPAFHNSRGIVLGQQKRSTEAIAAFRRAVKLNPQHLPGLTNLAIQLYAAGEFDEAETSLRRVLALAPDAPVVMTNLANLLQAQGRLREAQELYDRVVGIQPLNPQAHSARVLNSLYLPDSGPCDALTVARLFAVPHEQSLAAQRLPHANEADPERRLRIGYLSADFRRHSVAYFLEPILASHDHARFEIFCYSTTPVRDAVTARLEASADHWRDVRGLDDAALAQRIRADGIDILIDLAGHSAGNRLLVFARRPAPLQCTWIGFLATTGLSSIDYLLTDQVADPSESDAAAHAERLLRLPRSCLCFRPPDDAPQIPPLPALASGYVTFGSFNNPAKHNSRVLELWAQILTELPLSRLVLKGRGLDRGRLHADTLATFTAAGIDSQRIELQPYEDGDGAHLQRYAAVDIALDPFPHNGVTTTCLALWMGVPVLALHGDRHSARMCASVLHAAGLEELVAESLAEYRAAALSLARDVPRLARLRASLRERVGRSALCDAAAATADVERAYRDVWREWCRERPT